MREEEDEVVDDGRKENAEDDIGATTTAKQPVYFIQIVLPILH